MMRPIGRILFGLALTLLLPATSYAQATITGVVTDTSGAVLPGVSVEAASPALIEKVRTAVTDGSGQYQIVNLAPGSYVVTFTLPGFNTVVREGVALAGSFSAKIDADLRVGALEETITVTGESPIVDVQNTRRQRVIDREMIDEIPTSRTAFDLASLIPGVARGNLTTQDVGGSNTAPIGSVSIHGSRGGDQVVETSNFNDKTRMAIGGDFHGPEAHILERYTMADANTINWTMTITNPKVFTRPWTMTSLVPMGRRPVQIDFDGEDTCHEGNVDLVHLKNVYDQGLAPPRPRPSSSVTSDGRLLAPQPRTSPWTCTSLNLDFLQSVE